MADEDGLTWQDKTLEGTSKSLEKQYLRLTSVCCVLCGVCMLCGVCVCVCMLVWGYNSKCICIH